MTARNARANPANLTYVGTQGGKIAMAEITTTSGGVTVDFSADFRDSSGVVDLSGVVLRSLQFWNTQNAGTVALVVDGVTDGTNEIELFIPGGNTLEEQGFDTDTSVKLKDAGASSAVVQLVARYDTEA